MVLTVFCDERLALKANSEFIGTTLKRLAIGYGLLLTLAAGGLAFANIFGFVATAIHFGGETAPDTAAAKTWMHIGWVFGVCIALLGAVVQMRKRRAKQSGGEASEETGQEQEPRQASQEGRRHGLFASAAWGAFFGALLGTALGVTFILLWFSITYSPFAPKDWVESVSVERQRVGTSGREEPVSTTGHPVALIAFGVPVAFGTIAGAVFGGVVRVTDVE